MPLLSPALGETVPASPHATVLSLPTLADVESYERKEPRVWDLLRAGYPRFVRNTLVTQAAETLACRCGISADFPEALPPDFPSPPWAMFPLARMDIAERLAAQAGARILSYGIGAEFALIIVEAGDAATRLSAAAGFSEVFVEREWAWRGSAD